MFQAPHLRLLTTDFQTSFRFYKDTLGLTPRFGPESEIYAEFDLGGQTLALFERPLMAEAVGAVDKPVSANAQDAAMLVLMTENVDAATQLLKSRGVTFVAPPQDRPEWGVRTAQFRDPDGALIEINSAL